MLHRRRSALLALLLLIPAPSIGVAAGMWWWPDSTLGSVGFVLCKCWLLALPIIWHLVIDREAWSWSPARKGGWGISLAIGVAIAGLIFLTYQLIAPHLDIAFLRRQLEGVGLGDPMRLIVMGVYWSTINALLEEYVWRWFVVDRWARLVPGIWAIVLSGTCFAIHHAFALAVYFPPWIVLFASLGVASGGMVWSWLYLRYRSVWPVWLSHACVDVAIIAIAWSWLA